MVSEFNDQTLAIVLVGQFFTYVTPCATRMAHPPITVREHTYFSLKILQYNSPICFQHQARPAMLSMSLAFHHFAWFISHQPAVFFSYNKPATSNQPTVLFSQNKPAPAISHQPTEQAA
jgi:hypothetical protein